MRFASTLVSLCLAAGALAAPVGDIAERKPPPPHPPPPSKPSPPPSSASHPTSKSFRDYRANESITAVPGSVYQASPLHRCLSPAQATAISSAYQWLLANPQSTSFVPTATALLDPNFQDYSDSIDMLTGQALGSATFSGRQAFIDGSGAQPPLNVNTLGLISSCNAISWRWQSVSGVGDDELPVKGITNFEVSPAGQITTAYAEFNSWAFAKDVGAAP